MVLSHHLESRKVKLVPFDKATLQPMANNSGSWENEDCLRPTLTFARERYGHYTYPSCWDDYGSPIGEPKRKGQKVIQTTGL